jgi:zinc transporter ZupT
MAKDKAQTSIVTVVSFDGSSNDAYKIAMQRTAGSMVSLTILAVVTRAGMTYMQGLDLNKMFGINGLKVTEVTKENGNEL